jgi:hypothetical protein
MDLLAPVAPIETSDPELAGLLEWFCNVGWLQIAEHNRAVKWRGEHPYDACPCGSGKKVKFCDCY